MGGYALSSPIDSVKKAGPEDRFQDQFTQGGVFMADYCINVFLDDEQQKKIQEVGLGDHITQIDGKKAVQVAMSEKDQKKLKKGFPGLEFNESNACVLPDDAQITLMDIIMNMKSLDVMKFAITKLYNPLAGKQLRSKVH
jgi:hypothetical protein